MALGHLGCALPEEHPCGVGNPGPPGDGSVDGKVTPDSGPWDAAPPDITPVDASAPDITPMDIPLGTDVPTWDVGCMGDPRVGTAPARRFVAEWSDAYFFGGDSNAGGGEHLTFEVVLSEAPATLDVLYRTMTGQGNRATGDSATVGLQRRPGGPFEEVSFARVGSVREGTGYRWTPEP